MKHKLFTLMFATMASIGTMFAWDYERVNIGDLYYNLDATNQTAEVVICSVSYSGAIVIPSSVTYNSVTYSVTSIGNSAFKYCNRLTSVTIPNSVTSIGNYAFSDCSGLTSVNIPDGVKSIGDYAFYGCKFRYQTIPNSVTSIGASAFYGCIRMEWIRIEGNGLTSIGAYAFYGCTRMESIRIVGNGLKSIGNNAFYDCSNLKSVAIADLAAWCAISFSNEYSNPMRLASNYYLNGVLITDLVIPSSVTSIGSYAFFGCNTLTSIDIPNSVTSIGDYAFKGCTKLTSVIVPLVIPLTLGSGAFTNVASGCSIFVPCSAVDAYKSAWSSYSSMIKKTPSAYHVTLQADANNGNITVLSDCDEDYTMEAVPLYGYQFTKWSDGNTDNPRVAVIKSDTTFTAEFAIEKSGTCGDNNLLTWLYDDQSKTLTISGNGALTSNYTYGVEAPTQMTTLIIGDGVTAIGDNAFNGMATINHLFIGASVASIGSNAFADCRNFDDITCYATTVPTINATTFANIGNKQYVYLYIPSDRERAYRRDTYWGEFDIQIKSAASTTTDVVKVVPTETTAAVTWPAVSGAATYDLVIKDKSGNAICTLIFNAQGQLTQIAFTAPAQRDVYQQTQAAGFSFVITGLEASNEYNLAIIAKDSNGGQISAENISFTTMTPTAIDQITDSKVPAATKFIRDGKIYILRDGKVYDLTGREIM